MLCRGVRAWLRLAVQDPDRDRRAPAWPSARRAAQAEGQMSLSIQGKSAIVTGAARGIGQAIGRHFQAACAKVMFADSDEPALMAELGEQAAADGPVRAFAGDLGQKLTLANLVSATIDAFDRVDILVNAHRMVQGCDP